MNCACPDLCGGCPAMGIPTAIPSFRAAPDPLTVAAVRIEHGMYLLRRHHPRQQTRRQVVGQPRPIAQNSLGPRHVCPCRDGSALYRKSC